MKARILAVLLGIMVCMSGCGTDKAQEEKKTNQTQVVEQSVEMPQNEDAIAESKEEVVEESIVEETQTLKEWVAAQQVSEPSLAIWNDNRFEGEMLEYEEEYQLQEGDYLVLCAPEMIKSTYGCNKKNIVKQEYGGTYIKYKPEVTEPYKAYFHVKMEGIEGEFFTYCILIPQDD